MGWGNITTTAFAVSAASLFIRWRWPQVHPSFASAGLGASACVVVLSLIQPPLFLTLSLVVNAALLTAAVDFALISKPTAPVSEEAQGALLRLTFFGDDRHPSACRCENIASWFAYYSAHARIEGQGADGRVTTLASIPKTWAIFIAYDRPTEVSQVIASFNAPGMPPYSVLLSTKRVCVVSFNSDIPAGDLEIEVRAQ